MRTKTLLASGLALMAAVASIIGAQGCGDDEVVRRLSQKGETCQVTNDCAQGLACVPMPGFGSSGGVSVGFGGVCTVGEFRIEKTAKECAVIQCEKAEDCCDPPATCPDLLEACNQAGDAGFSSACEQYKQYCVCDTERIACDQNKCVTKCSTDSECSSSNGTPRCAGGTCVRCASDDDCSGDDTCISGSCKAPCKSDGDCPGFDRCVASQCTPSGCQTDRECVASTRNVEATCGTDGKCIVPCQTDLECGNPRGYSFFSCLEHQCVYTGCESEKDCRLLLTGPDGGLPSGSHVVCREATTDKTRPAQ